MLDDPKYVGGFVDWLLWVSVWLLLPSPSVLLLALALAWIAQGGGKQPWTERLQRAVVDSALLLASWGLSIVWLRWDVGGVVAWYMD
jgi:hypothetical protein